MPFLENGLNDFRRLHANWSELKNCVIERRTAVDGVTNEKTWLYRMTRAASDSTG